jgi:hypothetical protein
MVAVIEVAVVVVVMVVVVVVVVVVVACGCECDYGCGRGCGCGCDFCRGCGSLLGLSLLCQVNLQPLLILCQLLHFVQRLCMPLLSLLSDLLYVLQLLLCVHLFCVNPTLKNGVL